MKRIKVKADGTYKPIQLLFDLGYCSQYVIPSAKPDGYYFGCSDGSIRLGVLCPICYTKLKVISN